MECLRGRSLRLPSLYENGARHGRTRQIYCVRVHLRCSVTLQVEVVQSSIFKVIYCFLAKTNHHDEERTFL